MIYFDNAATTRNKPEEVFQALNTYLRDIGVSPGRGSYSAGIEASRMLYKARTTVGSYFGLSRPDKVLFTKNSTEAINLLFHGILNKGDHVLISCYEHNAVLRPLHAMMQKGEIDYSVINREDLSLSAIELCDKYVRDNTKLIALTLASNLTGRIIFRDDWTRFFHDRGILTFVDSSQGAGKIDVDMKSSGVDFLAFTGHKDLYGVPGAGGLCCEAEVSFEPLLQGGTGIHGDEYINPRVFPEGYEAGTLNMPAIWALKTGIDHINKHKADIRERETALLEYLIQELSCIEGITIFDKNVSRVATCCITLSNLSTDKVVSLLDNNGICVRGGIHCAILAHESLGTVETGAVRISLNYFNTIEEIDSLVNTLKLGE